MTFPEDSTLTFDDEKVVSGYVENGDGALVGEGIEGSGGVIATIHQRSTQSDPSDQHH